MCTVFGHGGDVLASVLCVQPFGHGGDFLVSVLCVDPFGNGSDVYCIWAWR